MKGKNECPSHPTISLRAKSITPLSFASSSNRFVNPDFENRQENASASDEGDRLRIRERKVAVSSSWRQSADSIQQPWKFLFSSKEPLRCIIVISIIMTILGLRRRGSLGPSAEQTECLRPNRMFASGVDAESGQPQLRRGPLGPSAEQISDLRSDNARGFGENRVVSG